MPSSYSASDYQTFDPRAFALKGGLFPLTLLEILKDDVGELRRELMLKAYETAVQEKYRFFSYGDCMLIL